MTYTTKDSGKREEYNSGMRRDTQEGKPGFHFLLTDLPYEEQMLTRWAELMARGAEKYGDRNWQLANSKEELNRFKASGLRHFMQWFCGETDEDHAAAVMFNLMAAEYVKYKMQTLVDIPDCDCDLLGGCCEMGCEYCPPEVVHGAYCYCEECR